jgi:glutamyl-tRNA reductase
VYLYTLDDLGERVRGAGASRQAAVHHAQAIVESGVRGFVQWLEQRRSVPLIRALNAQADAWRHAELARARRRLARGEPVDAVLDALASGLEHKLLHGARAGLRTPHGGGADALADAVQRMFLRPGAAPAGPASRAD